MRIAMPFIVLFLVAIAVIALANSFVPGDEELKQAISAYEIHGISDRRGKVIWVKLDEKFQREDRSDVYLVGAEYAVEYPDDKSALASKKEIEVHKAFYRVFKSKTRDGWGEEWFIHCRYTFTSD